MYYLQSLDNHTTFATFATFDKDEIKKTIINYLGENPLHLIKYSKDYKKPTKYAGTEHLAFFANNPVSNQPCKVIIKGEKELYKPLIINN